MTALPGTPLYDECIEKRFILRDTTADNLNYSKSNIKLGDITVDELEDIRRSVWKKAFKKRMDQNKEKEKASVTKISMYGPPSMTINFMDLN